MLKDESLTGTLITVNTSKGTFSTNKEIQYGTTVIGTGNTHVANEESDEEDGGTAKVNSS